MMEEEQ